MTFGLGVTLAADHQMEETSIEVNSLDPPVLRVKADRE